MITTPAADGYDLDGNVTIAGTAEAGSTVELFDGATSKGTTTATGGTWSIALTGVADGVHAYTAKATDAAPNTSGASNVRTITVDTAAPTITARSPLADATGVAVGRDRQRRPSRRPSTPATVTGTSVTLKAGRDRRSRRPSTYDAATDTISLNPDADLASGTTYTVSLTADHHRPRRQRARRPPRGTSPRPTRPTRRRPTRRRSTWMPPATPGRRTSTDLTKDATPDSQRHRPRPAAPSPSGTGTTVVASAVAAGDGTWSATADALAEGERMP